MPGPTFLDGDRVALRTIEEEDLDFLQRMANDERIWRYALRPIPQNGEQEREFFDEQVSAEGDVHLLACDDDRRLGVVSLYDVDHRVGSAELGYWLDPAVHGEGYGSDAASRLVRYAFHTLQLHRLRARVGAFNDASVALLESLGFDREGTLREAVPFEGDRHDEYRYGLLASEWRG
jgi:RimJ/RimL family protein N-acetyltransferase